MRVVFADAFFYIALANPGDPAHGRASAFLASYTGSVATTRWVLVEVANALARSSSGRSWFVNFHTRLLGDPNVRVVPDTDELYDAGLDLYARRPDKAWSLTDCVSFVVMSRAGIADALTGDHHFEQAGFAALLK